MHGIIHAILALLHFDLCRAADADDRDAAREFGEPLLELLAVVIGGGLLNLCLDLSNACLDIALLTGTADDRGVLLIDHHFLSPAEHIDGNVLELDAEVGGDHGAGSKDRDVLEHRLATIAEAWCLDGRDFEAATKLVDHEGRKRLALYILGNDKQRLSGLYHRLKERQQLL